MPYDTSGTFEIETDAKPIAVQFTLASESSAKSNSVLILSHGASGTYDSDNIKQWVEGNSTLLSCLAFNGNMNMKSRVKQFGLVAKHLREAKPDTSIILAGTSMGARAAATLYASDETSISFSDRLILQSYPLYNKTSEAARRDALTSLPASVNVLFVIGSKDEMCPLDEGFKSLREEMKAKSWLLVVHDAKHGLDMKGKKEVTREIRVRAGELIAEWATEKLPIETEALLQYKDSQKLWSGWKDVPPEPEEEEKKPKATRKRKPPKADDEGSEEEPAPKRRSSGRKTATTKD